MMQGGGPDGSATTRTTCPYCGVGCGVLATQHTDGSVTVKGDPEHPANFGRLCSKGAALGETLGLAGRLLHPVVNGARAPWDDALGLVAEKFSDAIRDHGPESVAFYVSGQLLTEDYYVANKLMKGYIGSANIDTNSRLCMASTVAGHRRAFGSDTVPGCYEDLELADLVLLVGSNLAWCHPVLFQRLLAAREKRGTRIIVIDPRRTVTADAADLHLAVEPDSDVALFAGLLAYLLHNGMTDPAVSADVAAVLRADDRTSLDLARIANETLVATTALAQFYEEFGITERVVTVFSQGVNQSACGTDKVNAIINCHLATGRIGKPGMGPFSVTGQPNAMGGREVGGLANMLAAHMNIEDAAARERVQRFWASPAIAQQPGLKAIDLFSAVSSGKIKALWIMGTNPAVSMPDADGVASALKSCPFVVVSDVVEKTDTTAFAHVLLPAAAWGEKDGTVTNSERRISRQRPFLPLPGEARPDWAIIADVARRMGYSGFNYAGPATVFAEHAALSGFENNGLRDFDISAYATVSQPGYDGLAPFQWPQTHGEPARETRFFGDGRAFTSDGKPRLVTVIPQQISPLPPGNLKLNTGRIRDQWHTMTRTGGVPRLMAQFGEPFCDIHPQDAEDIGLFPAELVELSTGSARLVVRARITPAQRPGSVFVPMHWTRQQASAACVNTAVPAIVDPVSGQPGLKAGRAQVSRYNAAWYAFAVSANRWPADVLQTLDYHAVSPVTSGFALECAGLAATTDLTELARGLAGEAALCDWVGLTSGDGTVRHAAFAGGRLLFAFFAAPHPVEVSRALAVAALEQNCSSTNRLAILAGRAGAETSEEGPTICACRRVGRNRIETAIQQGCRTVEAVGAFCAAGTECGACRPEIAALIAGTERQSALEIA